MNRAILFDGARRRDHVCTATDRTAKCVQPTPPVASESPPKSPEPVRFQPGCPRLRVRVVSAASYEVVQLVPVYFRVGNRTLDTEIWPYILYPISYILWAI